MDKVIFLDIDGVLVTWDSLADSASGVKAKFCRKSVANLNKLVEDSRAKIIVSSTWRLHFKDPKDLQALFDSQGLNVTIIDYTMPSFSGSRSYEIGCTLSDLEDAHFVVLDDDLSPSQNPFWGHRAVVTNMIEGFTDDMLREAMNLLASCPNHCRCLSGNKLDKEIDFRNRNGNY